MAEDFRNTILTSSGDDFFANLQIALKGKIPQLIKNILNLFDYNCAAILAKFDDASVISIEEDIRNYDAELLLEGEALEDYLGRFVKCQKKFKFFDGQRKWFALIVETCQRFVGEVLPSSSASTTCEIRDIEENAENGESSIQSNDIGIVTTRGDSLSRLIGSQMITVFNDAKRITLSAWSWPSREVASQLAATFKDSGNAEATIDLLYVSPSHHADLLNSIVRSDLDRFKSVLTSSLAISLRIDGSVDRMQKHNVYVLMNVVTDDGKIKTFFLGFDIPKGNSALSYHLVTKNIATEILPWDLLLSMTTSLVTDGEKKNTGHLQGLWQRLKEEKEATSNDPFITIWCVGHRLNLGWKATCRLELIRDLIKDVLSVFTYFHQSGEKTRQLAAVASEHNLNVPLHYPQHFEIRWTEYTHNMLYVFLRNWNAMIWHFKSTNEVGLENLWLSRDRIRLAAFVCDVLTVLKIFQKTFQSDSISILHLPSKRNKLMEDLASLKITPLSNGWEQLLLKEMVTSTDGSTTLRDHKLFTTSRFRSGPFTFSTDDRSNIIDSLIQNLNDYFNEDIDIQSALAPLLELDTNASYDSLNRCHSIIVPEMDVETFCIEYHEAANLLNAEEKKAPLPNVLKLEQNSSKSFTVLKLALARSFSIKPHSADVENIINVYNKYKDKDRPLFSKKTLFNNMYVHTNMCTVVEFDPTSATNYWLNEKERRPRYGTKSTQQEYFKGVFPEADNYKRHDTRKIEF